MKRYRNEDQASSSSAKNSFAIINDEEKQSVDGSHYYRLKGVKAQKREKEEAQDRNLMMERLDKLTTDLSAINNNLHRVSKSIKRSLGQEASLVLLLI